VYGIYDLHGLVWEWVEDFNALMISGDNREQGDPDLAKFCGAGALSVTDRENYAVLMRVSMLSSLQANYTTKNLGFRCAQDTAKVAR
jgi:formylglycine-generating enzyme